MSNQSYKIIIAGGGTGGHIYPAISIAEALLVQHPQSHILFVGTSLGMESKIIPRFGYKIQMIQSGKLNMKGQFWKKLMTLIKIPIGLLQALRIIIQFRPDFVLGVGGYASAPMLMAAWLCRCKAAIWEANAHPGMTNRILSQLISKAYIVFNEAQAELKSKDIKVFGMPLRAEIEKAGESHSEISTGAHIQSLSSGKLFTIVCTGGSQGSVFLNDRLSDFILQNPDWHSRLQVYHQTGAYDFQRMKKKYEGVTCVQVMEYIDDMPKYYQKADVLFCRGGASTLSEASAFGVVPIVVPLPAADDHQQVNAEALVKANAGFMLKQNQFDMLAFKKMIESLMTQPELKKQMSQNLRKRAPLKASYLIAQDIIESIHL